MDPARILQQHTHKPSPANQMIDSEISLLFERLRNERGNEVVLQYRPPVVPGRGHALELDSSSCFGTILVWANGFVDWNIFGSSTSKEALLGHAEVNSLEELRAVILEIFRKIREHDATNR